MFLYKNQFLLIFSLLSIPIELWESTADIFRQSAGYVINVTLIRFLHQFLCVLVCVLTMKQKVEQKSERFRVVKFFSNFKLV